MTYFLVCLLFGFQAGSETNVGIWQEISELEALVQRKVNSVETQGMVMPNDPVRGYYFRGQGIIFFIPIRYRTQAVRTVDLEFPNSASMMKTRETKKLEVTSWNQQMRDWKNQLKKREAIKDASFGEILQVLSKTLPELVAALPPLKEGESLTLVLEEREPAWVFGSFGSNSQFKRKITTLKVEGRHLALLRRKTQNPEIMEH